MTHYLFRKQTPVQCGLTWPAGRLSHLLCFQTNKHLIRSKVSFSLLLFLGNCLDLHSVSCCNKYFSGIAEIEGQRAEVGCRGMHGLKEVLYDVSGDGCHLIFSKNDKDALFMYNFSLIDWNRSQVYQKKEKLVWNINLEREEHVINQHRQKKRHAVLTDAVSFSVWWLNENLASGHTISFPPSIFFSFLSSFFSSFPFHFLLFTSYHLLDFYLVLMCANNIQDYRGRRFCPQGNARWQFHNV